MPKQTFFNLPQEKRHKIIQVAVEDFAEHGYDGASITRMVGRAGIAKGSFYQYFEDLDDLYIHLIETEIAQRKIATYEQERAALAEMNLTEYLRRVSLIQLREFQESPALMKISLDFARRMQEPIGRRVMERFRGMSRTYFLEYIREEQGRGELDPRVDADVLNFMLVSIGQYLAHMMVSGQVTGFDENTVNTVIDKLEYILTHGIYTDTIQPGS